MGWLWEVLSGIAVLLVFAGILAVVIWLVVRSFRSKSITEALRRHFRPVPLDRVAVTERQFPVPIRAELQRTADDFMKQATVCLFTGVTDQHGLGGADFSTLLDESLVKLTGTSAVGPPQYEHIDVGEEEPVGVLKGGLWLLEREGTRFAILYASLSDFTECGISQRVRLQVAATDDDAGRRVSREFFRYVEQGVLDARFYRGKVLSFEQESSYSGQASGVKVHRLREVGRDEVILPQKTLDLLDRNVINFVRRRQRLHELRMSTKKGLLFYGPPGTGKTHTIRYLAAALEAHTTFLISAEQVGRFGEYMTLARLLQPSVVVIEDVDLIARERTRMQSEQAELLLNKLLNEMDGLREDADILFILTTNRPEELEGALASRPGRIDQAIEFPLPDAAGREKLVRLYARGVTVSDGDVRTIVQRTEKVSPSFIKELMRRAAQFQVERDGTGTLMMEDIENALDEMLFSGGSLNLKLLGAEQRIEEE